MNGVVGATGQVGVAMRQILLERRFPVADVRSSPRPGRRARCCRSATARWYTMSTFVCVKV